MSEKKCPDKHQSSELQTNETSNGICKRVRRRSSVQKMLETIIAERNNKDQHLSESDGEESSSSYSSRE